MSLQEKLDSLRQEFETKAPKEALEIMHLATEELTNSGILERVLKVGDKAPDFELENVEGKIVASEDLYSNGPLVLSFFRGRW